MKIINYCNKLIEYSFYSLMFFVPLAFASDTFELFEFNKMWLTFGLTIIIAASWFIKMIRQSRIFIQRTPLDIPIILFLLSQIISTIFSWDTHISFWGYYSRFNGGLLSIISYIFLYYAFLSNFRDEQARGDASGGVQRRASSFAVPRNGTRLEGAPLDERAAGPRAVNAEQMVKRLLFVSLLSGLVVALWGLPSHFGYDPTCLLFRGTLDVSCWTADFQPTVRIFSTLGQPDWLAAYLAILLPISIIMFIKSIKNLPLSTFYLLLSALFYLDLLYTRARSGVLATWLSLGFFFAAYFWINRKKFYILHSTFYILLIIGAVTFFVGQPFSQLEKFTLEGIKKNITNTQSADKSSAGPPATQDKSAKALRAGELGGTDSGTIRKIVWQGAIDSWRHYPIFGTGVETFAFAYYRFRPEAHNLTSEWNFLYNKAHNEYLNYLATTGIVGLGTYLLMIGWFLTFVILRLKAEGSQILRYAQNDKPKNLLILALISGYISILVTNFFGFSVVITNIYLFLIPAFVFILGRIINPEKIFVFPNAESVRQLTDRISLYQWTFIFFIILASFFLLINLFRFWNADKAYSLGYNLDRAGEYQQANPYLQKAINSRSDEPVFKDELAINSAILAGAIFGQEDIQDASEAALLANQFAENAIILSDFITSKHPHNVVFWKSRVRIFYTLAQVDSKYFALSLDAVKKAKELAPTDANISYNLGVLYGQNNNVKKGIETLENTIKLKPDYRDAYYGLGLFYHDQAVDEKGNVVDRERLGKAIAQLQYILNNLGAEDKVAKDTLEQWKKL